MYIRKRKKINAHAHAHFHAHAHTQPHAHVHVHAHAHAHAHIQDGVNVVRDCSATPGGWLGCSDCLLPGLPAIQGWSKWQVEPEGY